MKKKLKSGIFNQVYTLVVACMLLTVSCANPGDSGNNENNRGAVENTTGSLSLSIGKSDIMRSILPVIPMTIKSYDITAAGPGGKTFTAADFSGGVFTKTLESGEWNITVNAKNLAGTVIYQGSGVGTIIPGRTTPVNITIRPLTGTGSLSLTLDWQTNILKAPAIESKLISSTGTPKNLDFTISGNTASYMDNTVDTGYHTLIVKLLDGTFLTRGAVEVVRIVKDQTTDGAFVFENINEQYGAIDINIVQELANPLIVSITGQTPELNERRSMTVKASVADYPENVTYVWYINGEPKETGDSTNPYYIVSGLARGYYRLDVTAFSVDGKRAGSATGSFQVTETAPYSKAAMLSAGSSHNLVLKDDGTIMAWGHNGYGQLGEDKTTAKRLFPLQVQGQTNIKAVSAGGLHSLALHNDGTVWAWGYNHYGQVGDGSTLDKSTPVKVSGLVNIIAVAAGSNHSLALRNDGTVWAWGYNNFGQLGNGTNSNRTIPFMITELSGVIGIASFANHSIALKSDGTVWAWGYNNFGQLGNGTTTNKNRPVQASLSNITAIAVGSHNSLALKSDGTVWAWGYNGSGQLGDGSVTNRTIPVQVSGLTNVSAISGGSSHSIALKKDGTVWAWGVNNSGQLGDGSVTNRTTPVQVKELINVTAISAGGSHNIALKGDATVWGWGYNTHGNIGDNTTINRLLPVKVLGF